MHSDTKKKEIAIFDFYLGGHHIEYLHHIYINAVEHKDINYTFIIPSNFSAFKSDFIWPESNNVKFLFYNLDDKYVRSLGGRQKSKLLCLLLKRFIKETGIKDVILIETIAFLPYLPLYISSKVNITSILYHLPIYHKAPTFKSKLHTALDMGIIAHSRCLKKVCLLNSRSAVEIYNKKYRTDKFAFLPDPYTPLTCERSVEDIKKEYGIGSSKEVFIHIGGLTRRKGTIEILDAIAKLNAECLKDKCFVFAGRVIEDIKKEFYEKIEKLKNNVQMIIVDRFCEYSIFAELCIIADYIIIPYKNTAQSSGICSYAAQFKVPVIGPAEGLLGTLIRENGLGHTINGINADKIAGFIGSEEYKNIKTDKIKAEEYLEISTPKNFFHHLIEL